MKITIAAADMISGLAAVIPHAGAEKLNIPAISAVKFELVDGRLYLIATDRYTIGVAHMTVADQDGPFEALIALRDAKQLLTIVKLGQQAWKIMPTDVTLTVKELTGGSNIEVTAGNKTHVLKLQHLDSTFPAWKSLIPHPDGEGAIEGVRAFNPTLMAKFARVQPGLPMLTYGTAPNKPMLVVVGEQFFGLIMPVRGMDAAILRGRLPKFLGGTLGQPAPAPKEPPVQTAAPVAVAPKAVEPPPVPRKDMPKRAPAKKAAAKKAAPPKAA